MKKIHDLGVWDFTDGNGAQVRVAVTLDEGDKLSRVIRRLTNRARASARKRATALAGALELTIVSDTKAVGLKEP